MFLQYIVFGITLAISIGPVNIELIKQGVTRGFLPSWLVGIGGMTADFVILSIIFLGLGSYFTSDIVQLLFGCVGAIMLIAIGLQNAGKTNPRTYTFLDGNTHEVKKVNKSFTTGFLLAIANPLNLVFWSGIYSSLLTVNVSEKNTPIFLITCIFIGVALSNITLALVSAFGKTYLKPPTLNLITTTSGLVLIGYGCWIGYQTISSKVHIVLHSFIL